MCRVVAKAKACRKPMEKEVNERLAKAKNGWVMLALVLLMMVGGIALFSVSANANCWKNSADARAILSCRPVAECRAAPEISN